MHIHILGICGTFMGGIAQIARAAGHTVSGVDENVYPPMSTQLEAAGIRLQQGYANEQFQTKPDCVLVGNVMSRGNPAIELLLNGNVPYTSAPQWLHDHVLRDKWVIAIAGTHGKTTTTSMVAWILEYAGFNPGFLVGGVPKNFNVSARLTDSSFFVIEADEYDTAFFDKRSKFLHYNPRTLVINNLEFDHADIFPDLASIQKQFHHLIRIVPGNGRIIYNGDEENIQTVLQQGCWSEQETVSFARKAAGWSVKNSNADGSCFDVCFEGVEQGRLNWPLLGKHNQQNALAAIAAARHVGVMPAIAIEALAKFEGVKRRMEIFGQAKGITIYDDFAHHPTAIATTLAGLRAKVGDERIIAVLELRSNTMRMGVHNATLMPALRDADDIVLLANDSASIDTEGVAEKLRVCASVEEIVSSLPPTLQENDHVLIMSNGGFGGLHQRLLDAIR